MNIVTITNGKLSIVFKQNALPIVNPSDPRFILNLNGVKIAVQINPKAARKLAAHSGGAVLQGKLVATDSGNLSLRDAGFNWLDPKPATEPEMSSTGEAS